MKSKYIKDYEGLYEVTEDGKVYSIPRTVLGNDGKNYTFKGRYLAPQLNKVTGYLTYSLWKNNKQTIFTAHRLVAEAFIENPSGYPVVNHLDGNKLNNVTSNLEWCTNTQNSVHAVTTGLKTYTNKVTKEDFIYYLDCVISGESFESAATAAGYKVPFFSQKLRKIAKELGIEDQLDMAIRLRRANRNRITCVSQREKINQLTLEGIFVMQHESLQAAAKYLNKKSCGSISNALNPNFPQNTAYGYRWERV